MQDDSMVDMNIESKNIPRSFRLTSDMPLLPPTYTFWDHPYDLSEILRSSANMNTTLVLQNSIVKLESLKKNDTRDISEFSAHVVMIDKMIQTDLLVNEIEKSQNVYGIRINKFLASQEVKPLRLLIAGDDVKEPLGKVNQVDMPIEIIKKIEMQKNMQPLNIEDYYFDSEAEYDYDFNPDYISKRVSMSFVKNTHIKDIRKKVGRGSKRLISLHKFVNDAVINSKDNKLYSCKFCFKFYNKRTALGGHTARCHPRQSDMYKKRMESVELNQIERDRLFYLRTVQHN